MSRLEKRDTCNAIRKPTDRLEQQGVCAKIRRRVSQEPDLFLKGQNITFNSKSCHRCLLYMTRRSVQKPRRKLGSLRYKPVKFYIHYRGVQVLMCQLIITHQWQMIIKKVSQTGKGQHPEMLGSFISNTGTHKLLNQTFYFH